MKHSLRSALALVIVAVLAGCATTGSHPSLDTPKVEPSLLTPGLSTLLSVKIVDRRGVVARVEGFAVDEPDIRFVLNDKGEDGDIEPGDGVWSLRMLVPEEAAQGDYDIQLSAYDGHGEVVQAYDKKQSVIVLTAVLTITIGQE